MEYCVYSEKKILFQGLPDYSNFSAVLSFDSGRREIRRACKEDEKTVFVFAKGMKKRGYRYDIESFLKNFNLVVDTDEEKDLKWHKRLNKATSAMEGSGLWLSSSVYETLSNLKQMTYCDKQVIEKIYWETKWVNGKRVLNWASLQPFIDKYPFIVGVDNNGEKFVRTEYLFEVSECQLSSAYYGKWSNARIKEEIKEAIANRRSYSCRFDNGYDGSVEIRFGDEPGDPRAWCSEEYRNCGNGHYYLLLDENKKLFVEND